MPLIRATITVASRIMLPAHTIFAGWVGVAWALQGDQRTNVPALYALRNWWPIWGSGIVLCVLALSLTIARLSKNRAAAAATLGAGVVVYLTLGVANFIAVFQVPDASYSSPAWALYVATAHLASLVSLAYDELTDAEGNHRRGV